MKYNLPKLILGESIEDDIRVILKGEADVLTVPRSVVLNRCAAAH